MGSTQADRRKGLVIHKWSVLIDIDVEYQDLILVAAVMLSMVVFALPCICAHMRNPMSRSCSACAYRHLHVYFTAAVYFDLFLMMVTVSVLPDWTVNEFVETLVLFITWVLVHVKKLIVSTFILFGFVSVVRFRDRLLMAAGMEHVTIFRWNWKTLFGLAGRKRPIELFIWKVDGVCPLSSMIKASDVFIECHLGHNEPMRTRVHNNAGTTCFIKQSFQLNIDEDATGALMTLLVKHQSLVGSSELARLMLSARELFGIEDQTGKRRLDFTYADDSFICLDLSPSGKIWIAIAPVVEIEEDERMPLMQEDRLLTC